jgi:hypothetical protein
VLAGIVVIRYSIRLVVWSQEFDRRLTKAEQGVLHVNGKRKASVLGHERGQALLTQVCARRRGREAA